MISLTEAMMAPTAAWQESNERGLGNRKMDRCDTVGFGEK